MVQYLKYQTFLLSHVFGAETYRFKQTNPAAPGNKIHPILTFLCITCLGQLELRPVPCMQEEEGLLSAWLV